MDQTREYPQADLLVTAEVLARRLNEHDLIIVDVRQPIPQLEVGHPWGHIPGAVYLDMTQIFDGQTSGVPGSLGSPDEIATIFSEAGLYAKNTVVVYDGEGGPVAAQLFWLLEAFGFPDVRLLEGGFAAWQAGNYQISLEIPAVEPIEEYAVLHTDRLAILDWLMAHLNDPSLALVDARTPNEYAAGHIPGSVSFPWDESQKVIGLVPRFQKAAELRARLESVGIVPDKEVVVYCLTGARSAHVYFTLRLMGYPAVSNYDGSWQEWGTRMDTPKSKN